MSELKYPLYLMRINDKQKFMSIQEAGVVFDSGFDQVEIGGLVLEADLSVREVTRDEERRISELADAHSESK